MISEGPVKTTDVVGDPTGKSKSEEGIRDCQVDQVQCGGVELLLLLASDVQDQAVA